MTTAALPDYNAAAIGDTFRRISDLIQLLKEFDIDKLTELAELVKLIYSAEDLSTRVKTGLQIVKLITEMTPTEVDDKFIDLIDKVFADEAVDVLVRLVESLMGGGEQSEDITILSSDRQKALAAGLPWSFLLQVALQIIQILETIQARKAAAALVSETLTNVPPPAKPQAKPKAPPVKQQSPRQVK